MNYKSKQFEKRKLKKLAEESPWWSGGSYYNERKGRYIRYWKSTGKNSLWATCKKYARKKARLYLKKYGVYTKKADDLWWNVW